MKGPDGSCLGVLLFIRRFALIAGLLFGGICGGGVAVVSGASDNPEVRSTMRWPFVVALGLAALLLVWVLAGKK